MKSATLKAHRKKVMFHLTCLATRGTLVVFSKAEDIEDDNLKNMGGKTHSAKADPVSEPPDLSTSPN